MLAAVRVGAPRRYRGLVDCLSRLPPPGRHAAIIIRCRTVAHVRDAVAWRTALHAAAPFSPFGLVLPPGRRFTAPIARCPCPVEPLLWTSELEEGRLPADGTRALWERTVSAALWREVEAALPGDCSTRDRRTLIGLVEAGSRGHPTATAARAAAMSGSTLKRWCRKRGLVPPGRILRILRTRAAQYLLERGTDRVVAARLCGWTNVRACSVFLRRNRDLLTEGDRWTDGLLRAPS